MLFLFFTESVEKRELCRVKFSMNDVQLLHDAIEDLYYFEFVLGKIVNKSATDF